MHFINEKRSLVFIPFLLLTWAMVDAQKWENPADQYKHAYKKHLNATCPISEDSIRHFVYFARDRKAIIDHPLLKHPRFKGAQIMYTWKDFEPRERRI